MIASNLPALQVVVPLVAAPICALVSRGEIAWRIALTANWIAFAVAIALLVQVSGSGTVSYMHGGWAAPLGIEYRVDLINAFVLLIVTGVGAVIMPYARLSVEAEVEEDRRSWFYTMYLLCLTGLLGVAITGDAFNIFVFLEISSLASYVLIALGRDRRALLAAYRYLIMGTIGATFIVIGIGLLWTMTGTLNLLDLAQRIRTIDDTPSVLIALAFLSVGISLKLALFPLHLWLPNAYAYAPSVASAFLAGTATKVAIYLFLRFFFTVFGGARFFETTPIPEMFLVLSVAAMFVASVVAVFQDDIKRMLAYSSVAQVGYITLGISLATETALTGSIVHLFNHALMKAGLFLLVGCMVFRIHRFKIDDLAGIGRRMPYTMAGFTVLGFSLLGVPGTVGFVSKWYLGTAAAELGLWWLVALIVLSSLITLIYMGRIVEVAYFREPTPAVAAATEAPPTLLVPGLLLAFGCVWFGIDTSLTVGIATRAAQALVAGVF
ncbi:MAG: multicomponent Na+:H+ antiporter subunit D [Gammaproteobacteria bacterium]